MRSRLVGAPWWVLALILGTFFGICMACFGRLRDPAVFGGGAIGLIIGVLFSGGPFGVVMGLYIADVNRRAMTAAGVDDRHEMATIVRATNRGPVPSDPRLRAAALNLAEHRLSEFQRQRGGTLTVLGLGTAGYIAAAVVWSPWWTLAAVIFLGILITGLTQSRRLERRIELLSEPDPSSERGNSEGLAPS